MPKNSKINIFFRKNVEKDKFFVTNNPRENLLKDPAGYRHCPAFARSIRFEVLRLMCRRLPTTTHAEENVYGLMNKNKPAINFD